ncbi:MAG: hypothetical protein WBP29_02360 [Candidatus Zixiibacteriota bacterium]
MSLVGFLGTYAMIEVVGEIGVHLLNNSMSLGLSCSAVLLICYNWKTADFVVTKKKAIAVFALMYVIASILGYLFGWFEYYALIFLALFLVICLFCGVFFTFCSFKLGTWQVNLTLRSRQFFGSLLALFIVILVFNLLPAFFQLIESRPN